jgi:hypothetical protein
MSQGHPPILQVLAGGVARSGEQVRLTVRTHHDKIFTLALSPTLARSLGVDLRKSAKAALHSKKLSDTARADKRLPLLKPCGALLSVAVVCLAGLTGGPLL